MRLYSKYHILSYLLTALVLLSIGASAQAGDPIFNGEKIVIQNKETGEWQQLILFYSSDCPITPCRPLLFDAGGITERSVLSAWSINDNDEILLSSESSGAVKYISAQEFSSSYNWFPYKRQTPLPNRATKESLSSQLEQLSDPCLLPFCLPHSLLRENQDHYDSITSLDAVFSATGYHVQGMAKLDNGSLVFSHSGDNETGTDPELFVVNPYSQEVIGGQHIKVLHGTDGFVAGMQASGNYLAVGITHENGPSGSEIQFFRAPEDIDLIPSCEDCDPIDGALVSMEDTIEINSSFTEFVGFTYIRSLDTYFVVRAKGKYTQVWTSPNPDTNNGSFKWKTGKKIDCDPGCPPGVYDISLGEAGIALIVDDSDQGYVLSLGQDGESKDTFFDYSVQQVDFSIDAKAKGEIVVGKPEYFSLQPGISVLDPLGPGFRWGGTATINEQGTLEIYQSARNIEGFLGSLLRTTKWSTVGQSEVPVNDIRARGRIVKVQAVENTEGLGDDDVLLIWDGKSDLKVMGDGDDDSAKWSPNFKISSPSANGTYVYVLEEDDVSGNDFIGEIYIPAQPYARPGKHQYTTTLHGDGSEYKVTYEVTGNNPPEADAGGPYFVDEGSSTLLNASGSSDLDGDPLSYKWDLDNDGSYEVSGITVTFSAVGRDGPDQQTVNLLVDDGMQTAIDSVTIDIKNVSPTIVSLIGPVNPIEEPGSATLHGTFTDPALDKDSYSGTALWDDGHSTVVTVFGYAFSTTRNFPDDHPATGTASDSFIAHVTIADEDGGVTSQESGPVTVNNVPPTASIEAVEDELGNLVGQEIDVILIGLELDLTASFADVGLLDTHVAAIDWDDGTVDGGFASSPIEYAHVYSNTGSYQIDVTVTDDDTGTVTVSETLKVVDAIGAVDNVIERLTDFVNDSEKDAQGGDFAQAALDKLAGNKEGRAANGAIDLLRKGNWNAAFINLIMSSEQLQKADPLTDDNLSVLVSQLALAAKSKALELLADAQDNATKPSELKRAKSANELIQQGNQLLESGDMVSAVDAYRKGVSRL